MRKSILALTIGAMVVGATGAGCDEQKEKPVILHDADTARSTTTEPATQRVVTQPGEATRLIPLGVIPFQADAPQSWAVQSGLAGRIVLHGALQSGDLDVLLSRQPSLNADDFKAFVAAQGQSATQPTRAKTQVLTRDNLTIVETVDKPIEGLVTYNVRYFVPGEALEVQVYELNIGDLTQEMYDKDGELIRKVLLGLKYDPSAAESPR
jgi:hypothetical protein